MADQQWKQVLASEVRPGERVRLQSGEELIATRVEVPFMGRQGMLAFIEDTSERWYKRPAQAAAVVEVLRH